MTSRRPRDHTHEVGDDGHRAKADLLDVWLMAQMISEDNTNWDVYWVKKKCDVTLRDADTGQIKYIKDIDVLFDAVVNPAKHGCEWRD